MKINTLNLFALLAILFLGVSCGGDEGGGEINIEQPVFAPRVDIVSPEEGATFQAGSEVIFEADTTGKVTQITWTVNESTVAPDADSDLRLTRVFEEGGVYTVQVKVENESGEYTSTLNILVEEEEIPRIQLLTDGSSKVWKYVSISLNEEESVIEEYEKDNTIEFFAEMQGTDNPTEDPYNYVFDVGQNTAINDMVNEEGHEGEFKLSFGDNVLELEPLYSRTLTIDELTETTLRFRIRYTETSTVYYTLEAQ